MWCWRVRVSGLPSYSEATKQPQCQAEPGCQSTKAFERIPVLGKHALFALKFGALFLFDLVSGSLFLGIWVLLVEYGTLDSSGDDFVRGCMLGSTVDVVYCIFSTLPWTRIMKRLVFVLTQNGEESWLWTNFTQFSTFTWTRILKRSFSIRFEWRIVLSPARCPLVRCSHLELRKLFSWHPRG